MMLKYIMNKIINWIKTHPRISLVCFVFLFFFLSIALIFGRGKNTSPNQSPLPTSTDINQQILSEPTIYPKQGNIQTAGTQTAISVFFTDPINPRSIQIQANPAIQFKVSTLADFPTRVILTPQESWESGTSYIIKIIKGATSVDGKKRLDQDFIINYTVQPVPSVRFLE
jgi:predicted PurR-regulated permease PerM